MIFVLHGEGPTDLGRTDNGKFRPGPMAILVDKISFPSLSYSFLEAGSVLYIDRAAIVRMVKSIRTSSGSKFLKLRTNDSAPPSEGVVYHYKYAFAFFSIAKEFSATEDSPVVAVFFRDGDGTHSVCDWRAKSRSISDASKSLRFNAGVAMVPYPKSEAWLLCCADSELTDCSKYENWPGSDSGRHSLKIALKSVIGAPGAAFTDCRGLVETCLTSPDCLSKLLTLSSFRIFYEQLRSAIVFAQAYKYCAS